MSSRKPVSLSEAIARQEGYYKPDTRANRNNNPGNINWGRFARAQGATEGDDKGYAIFPDPKLGFEALEALLRSDRYKGKTLKQALAIYAPPTGDARGANDLDSYVKNVCSWTGMQATDCIDSFV